MILIAGLVAVVTLAAADMPIGYVSHYPLIKHEDDRVAATGADVLIVRAPWSLIEPEDDQFDFSILDEQLQYAHDTGLKLVCLMEAGPAHAAGTGWMVDTLKDAGEMMAHKDGSPAADPSIFSPLYRRYLERYVHTVVAYLASHEYADSIYGYSNGCEWWYPLGRGYSPLAADAFREYLRAEYETLDALNERWGVGYGDWSDIELPRVSWQGISSVPQGHLVPDTVVVDACYCTADDAHVPVQPGETITASARFTAEDVRSGGVTFEVAWLSADDPRPMHIDLSSSSGPLVDGEGEVSVQATCPEGAARAWLLAKCRADARVTFHEITCTNAAGEQLAPNPQLDPALGGWRFIQWGAGEPDAVDHDWDAPGEAWISYTPSAALDNGAAYPLAVVTDWTNFRASAFAEFIDWMAAEIKDTDPTRPIVTYLTIGFANPFEWDTAQELAMQMDHIARAGEHLDVIGMQLAAAEGDYDSVTCALDMVRRYGKPTWAVDLLDFTRGVALGREGLTRISRSVSQHGGAGIQYYCWFGTPNYNYSTELGLEPLTRMIEDTRATAGQLGDARPACEVALVMPRMPLYGYLDEPANDFADFMGWYKLLVRLGVCPDVYTLQDLPGADLSAYRAVIVPDGAYLPREALPALADATLLTSGRFARRDFSGRPMERADRPGRAGRFGEAIGAGLLGEVYRQKPPTDVPPRLVCRDGGPEWDADGVARVISRLERLGVTVLSNPCDAPVTVVPFTDGAAFILPDRDWSGAVSLAGRSVDVSPIGVVVPLE